MQGSVMVTFGGGTKGSTYRVGTSMVYHFENVFDRRSGPRRGLCTVPIPIQPSP